MPIGLMTGVLGRSRFLLEDATYFNFFLNFQLPNSSNTRPDRAGGLNRRLSFPREMNRRPIACHPYKDGCHCTHCVPWFLALAFSSSIAFTIYCSMADTTVHTPAALVALSANADDSGHNSGMESITMATSSSPTRGATKMVEGEIPELTDFFKKTTVTEDDRQAYHDHGWLTGNLVSFIPEVDVPTVEGYTILCFKFQLATGLGLPPSKFLSSIMNYLECSLVHLNTNAVSALSSFIMLYDVSTGMNTSRLPSRAAGRVPSRGRFFWTCMTNPRGSTRLCSLQLSRISGRSHR
jgi:hypothetical protein